MQSVLGKLILVATFAALLGACSQKDPVLMNLQTDGAGPDEFQILPTKPLVPPQDFTALPEPTPGGTNLTDPSPVADAIDALGGNGAQAVSSGMRGSEQAVVAHASRYGVSSDIRNQLAAEDLEWRRKHNGRVLERLFNVNVYFKSYEKFSLDQYYELERLRRSGIWTPAAPPQIVSQ